MAVQLYRVTRQQVAGTQPELFFIAPIWAVKAILELHQDAVDRILRTTAGGDPCDLHGNGRSRHGHRFMVEKSQPVERG